MLPPEIAKELAYLEISASRRIRSLRFGQSRSRIRGSGYEFESHYKYQIGEDLRRVDWNVSARMQDLFLKRNFEEKEVVVFIVADVSRSMRYSTAEYSKRMRMVQVAASLAFSATEDNCHLGFMAFSDKVEAYEPPRKGKGHVWRVIDRLYGMERSNTGTNWETALRFLRSRLNRMSIIFLLSDFVASPDTKDLQDIPDFKAIARRHDIVPIIFEDQLETKLPTGHGLLRFRSSEGKGEMTLSLSSKQRDQYEAIVERRKQSLRDLFFSLGLECMFLPVSEPFMDPLMELFERRKKV
ncbi:MAG: DUF58 domain-containing protein [Acidobacteria bacterium]|nr:DUF58 domain-containing protein [Acidobacteriota bacterium]